jgi:hypothetical protein
MAWRYDPERIERGRAERERQSIANMDAEPLSEGLCYFIGCDEGLVKIGWSKNVAQRRKALQAASMYKLRILATARGGRTREMYYHRKFWDHAVGGEWFRRCPEIETEIAKLNERPRSVAGPRALTTRVGGSNGLLS